MTPERWQQVKEIFHSALALEPQARQLFLTTACAGHASLRREVESLIKHHERTGSFIDAPAYEAASGLFPDAQAELEAGETLGPYKILRTLGAGGMGSVYLAEDQRLGRPVALKLLPSHLTGDAERLRRFEQEARATSSLNHPNILTIYEIGRIGERQFIATEYIEGLTLRAHITSGNMKVGEVIEAGVQIASALSAAHQAGIVHRDIKPENIMLRPDGIVKVLDFGLAKLTGQQPADSNAQTRAMVRTVPGTLMGTVQYMSPEQARGLEVDVRTDIFSFGAVLYEMLSGCAPFAGATMSDVIVAILEKEPAPLLRHSKEVPEALEWIVTKALTKEKEDRYQTAREIWTDLHRLKQRLEVEAEIERTTAPEETGRVKRAERETKSSVEERRATLGASNIRRESEMEYAQAAQAGNHGARLRRSHRARLCRHGGIQISGTRPRNRRSSIATRFA
jgi:eukaryotic-like serine/threonine-protein kinase